MEGNPLNTAAWNASRDPDFIAQDLAKRAGILPVEPTELNESYKTIDITVLDSNKLQISGQKLELNDSVEILACNALLQEAQQAGTLLTMDSIVSFWGDLPHRAKDYHSQKVISFFSRVNEAAETEPIVQRGSSEDPTFFTRCNVRPITFDPMALVLEAAQPPKRIRHVGSTLSVVPKMNAAKVITDESPSDSADELKKLEEAKNSGVFQGLLASQLVHVADKIGMAEMQRRYQAEITEQQQRNDIQLAGARNMGLLQGLAVAKLVHVVGIKDGAAAQQQEYQRTIQARDQELHDATLENQELTDLIAEQAELLQQLQANLTAIQNDKHRLEKERKAKDNTISDLRRSLTLERKALDEVQTESHFRWEVTDILEERLASWVQFYRIEPIGIVTYEGDNPFLQYFHEARTYRDLHVSELNKFIANTHKSYEMVGQKMEASGCTVSEAITLLVEAPRDKKLLSEGALGYVNLKMSKRHLVASVLEELPTSVATARYQACDMALCESIRQFDITGQTSFDTFALQNIKAAVSSAT